MKILPLLLLGGGAYFLTKKKPKASSSTTISNDSKIGSKDIGYEIINCITVKIYNEQKAFQYAFQIGSQQGLLQNANVEPFLVGDCFEQLEAGTKEDAIKFAKKFFSNKVTVRFIFNLFRFAKSGYALTSGNTEDSKTDLQSLKNNLKELGIDTTDLQTELVVEMPKL